MEEEANTSALGGLDRHARIAADPVDRLLEQQRSAYRYRRSQSRGVLTPLGQQYEIISGPVDIEAPRRAQGELRRRGARSIRRTDRVRSGGPSRVDTASVVDVEDSGNHMGSKNHTGNDVTSVDHMVAELPVRAKDVEELRRFPRELLQSSEDRVRSIRIGVDTMSHSYSDGALLRASRPPNAPVSNRRGSAGSHSLARDGNREIKALPRRHDSLAHRSSHAFAEVQRRQRAAFENTLEDRRQLREALFSLSLQREQDLADLVRKRNGFEDSPLKSSQDNNYPLRSRSRAALGTEDVDSSIFMTSVAIPAKPSNVPHDCNKSTVGKPHVSVDKKSTVGQGGRISRQIQSTLWHEATRNRAEQLRFWQSFRQLAQSEMNCNAPDKPTEISVYRTVEALKTDHSDRDGAIEKLVARVRDLVVANADLDAEFLGVVIDTMDAQLRKPNQTRASILRLVRHIAARSKVSDAELEAALPRVDLGDSGHAKNVRRFSMSPTFGRRSIPGEPINRQESGSFAGNGIVEGMHRSRTDSILPTRPPSLLQPLLSGV
eukprot:scaffold230732_cov32-Tisochrysis_lutea.AAC.1